MKTIFESMWVGTLEPLKDFLIEKGFRCWIDFRSWKLIVKHRKKNSDLLHEAFEEYKEKSCS